MDVDKRWPVVGWLAKFILGFTIAFFIVAEIVVPHMGRSLGPAKRAACASNLGSICKAISLYRGG